ncbi:MAG: hypothetical protein M3548_02215 [Actinomycetota bacterium]|nr:hypothetical protein [Actinomycetota bacterium]
MSDRALLSELAGLLSRLDPMPPSVRSSAVAAGGFLGTTWDWLDLSPQLTVAVRGPAHVWRSAELIVEVGDRLAGIVTTSVTKLELHSASGVVVLSVDESGCFSADLPPGFIRIVLYREDSVPQVSAWFR